MEADRRPNIVFILCDNVGWGDFACYGEPLRRRVSTSSPATAWCVEPDG